MREDQYLIRYHYGGLATLSMCDETANRMASLPEVDQVRKLYGYSTVALDPTYLDFKEKAYESLS